MISVLRCKMMMHKDEPIQGVCQNVQFEMPNRLVCCKCVESHIKDNICKMSDIKDEYDLNAMMKDYKSRIGIQCQHSVTYCLIQKLMKIKELQKYIESWMDVYKKFDYLETIIKKQAQGSLNLDIYLNDISQITLDQYLNNSMEQFIKIEKFMNGHPNFMIEQEIEQQQSELINSIQEKLNKKNDQIKQNLQMNNDEILQFITNQKVNQMNNYEILKYQLGDINNLSNFIQDDEQNFLQLKLNYFKQSMHQQGNLKIGILDSLLEFYSQITKNFPLNIQALEKLAKIYVQKRQYSTAISYYDKCIQINPLEYRFYHNKANLLYTQLDNANEALKCYDQYIKIYNTNYNAQIQKAQIYQKQNNYGLALSCFYKYIKIDPNYQNKQQFQKAYQDCCSLSIKYDKLNHQLALIQNCQWHQQQQKYKTALKLYIEYISIDKQYYQNIDIIKGILECCDQCINSDKTCLIAYMTKSNLLSQQYQFTAAIQCYGLCIMYNNNDPLKHDYDLSILECCDRFINNEQQNPIPYIKKAQILQQMNKFQAAIQSYDSFRNINADYYLNNEFFLAFLQCCDQYIDSDQHNHIPYFKKSQILEEKKDYKQALECYQLFIQRNTAQYLQTDSFYIKVIKCCDWYIINNKEDYIPQLMKAQMLKQKGYYREAQFCYKQCIKLSNNEYYQYEATLNKGLMLKQDKQYKESIECFDKCIEMESTKNEAQYQKKLTENLLHHEQCVIY